MTALNRKKEAEYLINLSIRRATGLENMDELKNVETEGKQLKNNWKISLIN